MNKYVTDNGGIDLSMPNCALWAGIDKTNLQKYLENDAKVWDNRVENVPTYPLGGTIGTHVGPGAVGLAFFRKNKENDYGKNECKISASFHALEDR